MHVSTNLLFLELETNPFARKHNASESSTTRNPFSSRSKSSTTLNNGGGGGITGRGSIQKSDSFFDKVEAATENGKKSTTKKSAGSKSKDKSSSSSTAASAHSGSKQTTLFGMMPRAFQTSQAPKMPSGEDKRYRDGNHEDGEDDGIGEETQELLSSCPLDMTDIEASDSQMTLMDSRGLEETQIDK
jgi:chromosome transmission fidelity protein 4